MSKTIDEKVLELKFDNKQFEANIKTSMNSLEKLKQSMNFSNAAKSFDQITRAADNVSFRGLEKGMDKLETYMSVKTMAIFTVVSNMVTKIQNSFESMAKEFTVVPIKTGFEEYELKMGAVQTIMSATGADINTVNGYLEELNKYADKTIYSFKDMTTNIGKFTNAGVSLDDAVIAMKGISNEAAVSGANAAEASRAMYNLAQSISMGYVQLIDWKSIENANMATKEFKTQLADTAVKLNQIVKIKDDEYEVDGKRFNLQQLFKDGLKEQWLTTDVLIDTLKDYADETTQIGKKAYAAAQDVKTFTMMMDTLKEAVQSGWAQTWEIILGDFEQAKRMFTYFSNMFGDFIDGAARARNAMVRSSMDSYYDKIINKLKEVGADTEAFENGLKEMFRANNVDIDALIEQYGSLGSAITHLHGWTKVIKEYAINFLNKLTGGIGDVNEVVADAGKNLEHFQELVNKTIRGDFGNGATRINQLTEAGENYAAVQSLVNQVWERNNKTWSDTTITQEMMVKAMGDLTDAELVAMGVSEEHIDDIRELSRQLQNGEGDISEYFNKIDQLHGRDLLFESLKNVVTAVAQRFKALKEAWAEVFPPGSETMLEKINKAFYAFTNRLLWGSERANQMKSIFKGLFSVIGIIVDVIKAFVKVIFPPLDKAMGKTSNGLLSILARVGESIFKFREFLNEGDKLKIMAEGVVGFIRKIIDTITNLVQWLWNLEAVQNVVGELSLYFKGVVDFWTEIWNNFVKDIGTDGVGFEGAFKNAFKSIGDAITSFIKKIPILGDAFTYIMDIPKKLKEAGNWSVQGFFQGIWEGIKQLPKIMVEFAMTAYNAFCNALGIHSPSKMFFKAGEWTVKGFVAGIMAFAKLVVKSVTRLVDSIINAFSSKTKKVEDYGDEIMENLSFMDRIKTKFAAFIDVLKNLFGGFIDILKPFIDKVKEYVGAFWQWLKDLPWGSIIVGLMVLFQMLINYKIVNAFESFGIGAKYAGKGLLEFAKGVKKIGAALKITSLAIAIAAFAGAMAVLVFLVRYLAGSDIDYTKALEAVTTIGVVLAAVIGVFGLVIHFGGEHVANSIEATSKVLLGLAGVILSICISLMVVIYSIQKVNELTDTEKEYEGFKRALGLIERIAIELGAFITVMAIISSKLGGGGKVTLGIAAAILAISISTSLIVRTIQKYLMSKDENGVMYFDEEKAEAIKKGFWSLFGIIATMSAALVAITFAAKGGSSVKGAATAILGMSISLLIIIGAISYFDYVAGNASNLSRSYWSVVGLVVVLAAGMAIIIGAAHDVNPGALKTVRTLVLIITAGILGIIIALGLLGEKQVNSAFIVGIVAYIIGILGAIGIILHYLTGNEFDEDKMDAFKTIMKYLMGLIGVMTACIILIIGSLTMLDNKTLTTQHVTAIVGAMIMLLGSVVAVLIFLGKVQKPNTKKLKVIAESIAIIIGALTAAIGIIILALMTLDKKTLSTQHVVTIIAGMITLLAAVAGVLIFISKLQTNGPTADKITKLLKAMSNCILAMSVSIGIISLSLMLLDGKTLSASALSGIIVGMAVLLGFVGELIPIVLNLSKQGTRNVDKIPAIIDAISIAVVALSAGILIISFALSILNGVNLTGTTLAAIIVGMVVLLAGVGELLGLLLNFPSNLDTKKAVWIIAMMDVTMIALAGSIFIIAKSIKELNNVNLSGQTLAAAIVGMLVILAALFSVMKFVKDYLAMTPWYNIVAAVGMVDITMVAFAYSFSIIANSVKEMSNAHLDDKALWAIAEIFVGMLLTMWSVIGYIQMYTPKDPASIIEMILSMVAIMGVMTYCLIKISEECTKAGNFNAEQFWSIMASMWITIAVFAGLSALLSKLNANGLFGAVELVILAAAIYVLAEALKEVTTVDTDALKAATIAILALLAGLLIFALVLGGIAALLPGTISKLIYGGVLLIVAVIVVAAALLVESVSGLIETLAGLGPQLRSTYEDVKYILNDIKGSAAGGLLSLGENVRNAAVGAGTNLASGFSNLFGGNKNNNNNTSTKNGRRRSSSAVVTEYSGLVNQVESSGPSYRTGELVRDAGEAHGEMLGENYQEGLLDGWLGSYSDNNGNLSFDSLESYYNQLLGGDIDASSMFNIGSENGEASAASYLDGFTKNFQGNFSIDKLKDMDLTDPDTVMQMFSSGLEGQTIELPNIGGGNGITLDMTDLMSGNFDMNTVLENMDMNSILQSYTGSLGGVSVTQAGSSLNKARDILAEKLSESLKLNPSDYAKFGIMDERDMHYIYETISKNIVEGIKNDESGLTLQEEDKNKLMDAIWGYIEPDAYKFNINPENMKTGFMEAINSCADQLQTAIDNGDANPSVWGTDLTGKVNYQAALTSQNQLELPEIVNTHDAQVMTAINQLKATTESLGNRIASMQVMLDTNALVGNLYEPISNRIGNQFTMSNRGSYGYMGVGR